MDKLFKKAAVLTDLHFGRGANSAEANQDNLDFIDWFIDKAKTEGCETCIQMGDWHDSRHSLHLSTLDYSLRGIEKINAAFDKVICLLGNHDLLYRDKRDVASVTFAKHLPNIQIIEKPIVVGDCALLPWLVPGERQSLKGIKARYTFGHLECNGGFMMNARVPMPDHEGAPDPDDFINQEYAFSGHFHFRQAKQNLIYTGNIFPFNFADAGDADRGMMILEWGREPEFHAWPDQPLYRTMLLSQMLNQPDRMLCQKLTARVTMDLDLSFEEAQTVRDAFLSRYSMRKIELVHPGSKTALDHTLSDDITFESVDQIVIDGLMSFNSEAYRTDRLVEIYRSLPGNL